MAQLQPDPFASLFTAYCHVTNSQSALHRAVPFVRHHELFPGESSSSQYHIPVETTEIRMESPPEEENEFPSSQEDSLPPATSPEPMILERETRVMVEPERKRKITREVIYSLKEKDKVFDKMPMRKQEAKMVSIEASDLGENCDFLVRKKQALKVGVFNNISSVQTIDLDDEEECANFPMRNNIEAESGPNVHTHIEIGEFGDVAVPTRSGEVEIALNNCVEQCGGGNEEVKNKNTFDLPKGDDVCHKGKVTTRVFPRWIFNKDGLVIRNGDPNEEMKKKSVEKNMFEIDKSKSNVERTRGLGDSDFPSSVSGKIKEDETMKNLLDGLDLVISVENEKVGNSEPNEKVDILEIAMRRGLICTRVSWWPPEKKIQGPSVGEGSGPCLGDTK